MCRVKVCDFGLARTLYESPLDEEDELWLLEQQRGSTAGSRPGSRERPGTAGTTSTGSSGFRRKRPVPLHTHDLIPKSKDPFASDEDEYVLEDEGRNMFIKGRC